MKLKCLKSVSGYALGVLIFLFAGTVTHAQSCGLFFSEYIEGSSNNKAVEIYNNTGADLDLAPYKIYRYNNGVSIAVDSLHLTGILTAGDVYVAGNPTAVADIVSVSDTLHTITFFNGDDALAIVDTTTGTVLDVFGLIGNDPGTNWPVGTGATSEFTLVRNVTITEGTSDWATNSTQWDVYPLNTFTYLGAHTGTSCCEIDYTTQTVSSCDSYLWIDGVIYTESNNTATHTLTNSELCDSVVTLNLTITHSNTGVDTQVACDSYEWIDGLTYTESNYTATFELTNAEMCDSIVTLNLTITHSNTGVDTQVACDSYEWIDGLTYTESNNTATFELTNSEMCDSVVTLNLTINESPDNSVSQNTNTLTASQEGANYQWLDCDNGNSPIDGETNRTFTAEANGNYACEIELNGCTSVSMCYEVTTVGLIENNSNRGLSVYPNPTTGIFTINSDQFLKNAEISIRNILGQEIKSLINDSDNYVTVEIEAEAGIYYVHIITSGFETKVIKIVKE